MAHNISYTAQQITDLLESGVHPNTLDAEHHPMLHSMVYHNNTDLVSSLLSKGADVNFEDRYGRTAIYFCRSKDMAELLIANGATVNHRGVGGYTPLHSILYGESFSKKRDLVECLLINGADVNGRGINGMTPLQLSDNDKTDELLLKYGANLDEQDAIGNTVLHYSARYCDLERTKWFWDRGGDCLIINADGRTAKQETIRVRDHRLGMDPDEIILDRFNAVIAFLDANETVPDVKGAIIEEPQ